jgi:uncharacterized protein YeaO (DUF488 family)
MEVYIGRLYDEAPAGALRVLVDRLWPRGVRKEGAPWDVWLKDVTPSDGLRRWYHAHPEGVEEFRRQYLAELDTGEGAAALGRLAELGRTRALALLTSRRDVATSHVPILRDALLARERG